MVLERTDENFQVIRHNIYTTEAMFRNRHVNVSLVYSRDHFLTNKSCWVTNYEDYLNKLRLDKEQYFLDDIFSSYA